MLAKDINNDAEEALRSKINEFLAKATADFNAKPEDQRSSDALLKIAKEEFPNIADRLISVTDEDEDGILKLSLLPANGDDVLNHTKASQVVEFRCNMENAYNLAKTKHFYDRNNITREVALDTLCKHFNGDENNVQYKKLSKKIIALDIAFKEDIEANAKIDKKEMLDPIDPDNPNKVTYGGRDNPKAKKYFKNKFKNGRRALEEYFTEVDELLKEINPNFDLKTQETAYASKKRIVYTNVMISENNVIVETHDPQNITQLHASSSDMENGIHNHLTSTQEIFDKEGTGFLSAHEIVRSSVITSIGLLSTWPLLLFEGKPEPFIKTTEITPKKVMERNKTAAGRQENLFLFKKLAYENMAKLLYEAATKIKDGDTEVFYCLQTILSPLPKGPLNLVGIFSKNPDRSMVEACAAATYRQEGRTIVIDGKNLIARPFYLNIGVNVSRGNGGALERGINARGFNNLLDLTLKKLGTKIPDLDFDDDDKKEIEALTNEKVDLYITQENTRNPVSKEIYYAIQKDIDEIEKKITALHLKRAKKIKKAFKEHKIILELTGDEITKKKNKNMINELFQLHQHMNENYNYKKHKSLAGKIFNVLGPIFIPIILYALAIGPAAILGVVSTIAYLGAYFIGPKALRKTLRTSALAGIGIVIGAPIVFIAGIISSPFSRNTRETFQAGWTFLNRKLGLYSNDQNYFGPTLVASIMDNIKKPYHFTCKSGEDRTGLLDNSRKAHNVLKKQNPDLDIINKDADRKKLEVEIENTSFASAGNQTNGANSGATALQLATGDINGKVDYKILNDIAKLASLKPIKENKKKIKKSPANTKIITEEEIKAFQTEAELTHRARNGNVEAQKELYILQNKEQTIQKSVSVMESQIDDSPEQNNTSISIRTIDRPEQDEDSPEKKDTYKKSIINYRNSSVSIPSPHNAKSEIVVPGLLKDLRPFLTKFTTALSGSIKTVNDIHNLTIKGFDFTVEVKAENKANKTFAENSTSFSFKPETDATRNETACGILGDMVGDFKKELNKNETDKKEFKAMLTASGPNPEKILTLLYIQCRKQGFENHQIQLKQPPVMDPNDFENLKNNTVVPAKNRSQADGPRLIPGQQE